MIRIRIKDSLIDVVLREAGYELHPRGYFDGGYVRDIREGFRFHAKVVDINMAGETKTVEIHMDRTIGFHHKVEVYKIPEAKELKILKRIIHKYTVPAVAKNPKPLKKKRYKGEIVPNVREIQKQHHGTIITKPNPLTTLWRRISSQFR